jgi:haloacetate dehalogenase
MAADMVMLMSGLGFDRYAVMGHDRGGRVAYRLALDHPQCVERLVALDILTTWDQWKEQTTHHRMVHWAFLAQPAPIPETLIGGDPADWVEGRLKRGTRDRSLDSFDPRALADYRESLSDRDRVHSTCEDFRATASCDLLDEEADLILGRRIVCPMLVLWGLAGNLEDIGDPIALWRAWCPNVSGCAINCGHFIPEEDPSALLSAVLPFLTKPEASA